MKVIRIVRASAALVLALVLTTTPTSIAAGDDGEPKHAIELRLGQHAFWSDTVEPEPGKEYPLAGNAPQTSAYCGDLAVQNQCKTYTIEVMERGARLRVAVDYPMTLKFGLGLFLTSPDGREAKGNHDEVPWSLEAFLDDPEPGIYTAWVWFILTEDCNGLEPGRQCLGKEYPYRMRAKVESTDMRGPEVIPPNLRMLTPFGLRFDCQRADERPDSDPPPIESGLNCLRFATGHTNEGPGRLDLHFNPALPPPDGGPNGRVTQWIYDSAGAVVAKVPAGQYEFHPAHGHFHYRGLFVIQLFAADPSSGGAQEPAMESAKLGNCGHDWKMVAWRRFIHAERGLEDSQNDCFDPAQAAVEAGEGRFGLSTGWADVYWWDTSDNYVVFDPSSVPAGASRMFVLRATADIDGTVTETDDSDNASYTLLRVSRGLDGALSPPEILEQGYGRDPTDPTKEVLFRRTGDVVVSTWPAPFETLP